MRIPATLTLGAVAAATLVSGCVGDGGMDPRYRGYRNYDYNHYDQSAGGYYADKYYVDNPRYRERRLGNKDRVYAGRDGRYYCRRPDGTTGLIVGGVAGGALGALLTSGRSEPLGVLLGAAGGAVAGRAIDRNNVKCR